MKARLPKKAAIWATAAYRLDNDPIIVRGLNDVGFFLFNLTYSATSLQARTYSSSCSRRLAK